MIINEGSDSQYTNRAKESYNEFDPTQYIDKLSKLDMENPDKVKSIIPYGTNTNGSCSAYAGKVAKMMDYYHLSYKLFNGVALDKSDPLYAKKSNNIDKVTIPNHTWLVHNGKNYETFGSNTEHFKITSEFSI